MRGAPSPSSRADRLYPTDGANVRDPRSPSRRDRDRILYSAAFRRLGGITQVAAPTERYPLHNRLTHTLEVAQIGRSLAENLTRTPALRKRASLAGGIDPDVVEAAALAHDLGHPPFGHVAEKELDELVKRRSYDGFEGNAQSFRIVTRLAVRDPRVEGLNLTRATLCALLKYPWTRAPSGRKAKKWGAYTAEESILAWARAACPLPGDAQSVEAALMDWADDVAYAVHDLGDFFRAGLIPFDRLVTDTAERERFLASQLERHALAGSRFDVDDLQRAFNRLVDYAAISAPYRGSRLDQAGIYGFTSKLIDRYVNAVSLRDATPSRSPLAIEEEAEMEVTMLKGLTWHYVIENRALTTQRFGQRGLIRSLFETFCQAAASRDDWHVFPAAYQETLRQGNDDATVLRTVADLMSSMSEQQVVEVHHRLTGHSLGSAMDPILP
jgi:dGTPase